MIVMYYHKLHYCSLWAMVHVWIDLNPYYNKFIRCNFKLQMLFEQFVHVRGVIKKFVDWCDEINTYLAMLTNFVRNMKQQMFY